jgi:hypothetical protein
VTERFDDVVRNAFDFLGRSIDELEARPKFSVIHFYSAIELLVKARLLKEHWSLIVAKPEQADKAKFQRGDFQSVGLKEANDRLSKIADDGLLDEEMKCFDGLRQERNQMVHFAHASQGDGEEAAKEMDRIVSDHAKGWLYLRRLLVGRWAEYFAAHVDTIQAMDRRMREQTKSLERKFLLLTDDIEAAKAGGSHFMHCPSCGFESFEVGQPLWVGEGQCKTCEFESPVIALDCVNANCAKPVLLVGGYEWCPECAHKYTPEQVETILDKNGQLRPTDYKDSDDLAHVGCGSCGGYETVVPLASDEWFCIDCFDIEEHIGQCEWCTGYSTQMPEHSYMTGCSQCEGQSGYMRDKDD